MSDPLAILTTILSVTSGIVASVLIYRNTRRSNQTTRENNLIDQLQEQVTNALRESSEAKAEARSAREESARARADLATMSAYAWQLYDHILRGSPPPPPEWPKFATN